MTQHFFQSSASGEVYSLPDALAASVPNGSHRVVVLNPEDREQVERLARDIEARHDFGDNVIATSDIQDALHSLITPPKPPEPQGLGAVVEDEHGDLWLRVDWVNPWCIAKPNERQTHQQKRKPTHDPHVKWADVAAVRVLSEGWSE